MKCRVINKMQQTFVRSIIPNYVNKLTNLVLHSPKMKNKILERPESHIHFLIEISKGYSFPMQATKCLFCSKSPERRYFT